MGSTLGTHSLLKKAGENFICPIHFSFVLYSPVLSVNFKSYSRFLRSSSP